jgi:hypothetical protein
MPYFRIKHSRGTGASMLLPEKKLRRRRDDRIRRVFTDLIWRHAPARLFSTSSQVAREKKGSKQVRQSLMA